MDRVVLSNPAATSKPGSPYSPGIALGDSVYLSGQTGVDPATRELSAEIEGQTRQALTNMGAILGTRGGTLADVVSITVFIVRRDDLSGMNAVYREFFQEPFPARTTVIVAGLGREELLVEIQAVAGFSR